MPPKGSKKRALTDSIIDSQEVSRTFTVVSVDYVGFGSWIQTFKSETALRAYLLGELKNKKSFNEEKYSAFTLKNLIDEAVEYLKKESMDGSTAAIVAIVEGGDCILYENDHSGKKNKVFSRKN